MSSLSLFYVPRRLALFVPAFVRIEYDYYRLGFTVNEVILKFCEELSLEDLKTEFTSEELAIWDESITKDFNNMKKNIKEYLYFFEISGQSFRGWNFENLTYQREYLRRKFQGVVDKRACVFLGIPSNQWSF